MVINCKFYDQCGNIVNCDKDFIDIMDANQAVYTIRPKFIKPTKNDDSRW